MRKQKYITQYREEVEEEYCYCIELITEMRHVCKLSQQMAADNLNIERSELTRYENMKTKMGLNRFIYIRTTYYHYIEDHHLEISEKMRKLAKLCDQSK